MELARGRAAHRRGRGATNRRRGSIRSRSRPSNVAETQQENVRAFIAGVLLGIAGGAVITLIAELVKIRRIRSGPARRPAPAEPHRFWPCTCR